MHMTMPHHTAVTITPMMRCMQDCIVRAHDRILSGQPGYAVDQLKRLKDYVDTTLWIVDLLALVDEHERQRGVT